MSQSRTPLPVEDPRRHDRIRRRTAAHVLDKIDRRTAATVFQAARGGPTALRARMEALDHEWDLERYLTLNFAVLSAVSSWKGRKSLAWTALLRVQQGFLAMHALAGWCPPTAVLRRLGVRTRSEIDAERAVLAELLHLMESPEIDEQIQVIEETIVYEPATATRSGTADRW